MKKSLTIIFFAAGFLLLLGTIDLLGWLPPPAEAVPDIVAIVVGCVFGALAAIPTSLLLLVILTRQERQQMEEEGRIRQIPGGIEWHN